MSSWSRREDTRRGDMAHGITFVMYERHTENTRGEAAINARKVHVSAKASLTLALGQHKYGDEIIAQIYTKNPADVVLRDRRADGYARVQVYLGPVDAELLKMLEQLTAEVRRIVS